jgi:hypothetical protein
VLNADVAESLALDRIHTEYLVLNLSHPFLSERTINRYFPKIVDALSSNRHLLRAPATAVEFVFQEDFFRKKEKNAFADCLREHFTTATFFYRVFYSITQTI